VGDYLFTFGLFGTLYLIFIRVAPVVAIAEVKSILKSSGDQYVEALKKQSEVQKEEAHH
jgi:molybdopterin-containing oxidoreductase family membrane subunit